MPTAPPRPARQTTDRQIPTTGVARTRRMRDAPPPDLFDSSTIERKTGNIVCVSSAAGSLGVFGYSAYRPTKYAVRGLCDIIHDELRPHGVAVPCVFPSDVDTPQLAAEGPHKPAESKAVSGTIKSVPPGQVADAILKGIRRVAPIVCPGIQTRWWRGYPVPCRVSPGSI